MLQTFADGVPTAETQRPSAVADPGAGILSSGSSFVSSLSNLAETLSGAAQEKERERTLDSLAISRSEQRIQLQADRLAKGGLIDQDEVPLFTGSQEERLRIINKAFENDQNNPIRLSILRENEAVTAIQTTSVPAREIIAHAGLGLTGEILSLAEIQNARADVEKDQENEVLADAQDRGFRLGIFPRSGESDQSYIARVHSDPDVQAEFNSNRRGAVADNFDNSRRVRGHALSEEAHADLRLLRESLRGLVTEKIDAVNGDIQSLDLGDLTRDVNFLESEQLNQAREKYADDPALLRIVEDGIREEAETQRSAFSGRAELSQIELESRNRANELGREFDRATRQQDQRYQANRVLIGQQQIAENNRRSAAASSEYKIQALKSELELRQLAQSLGIPSSEYSTFIATFRENTEHEANLIVEAHENQAAAVRRYLDDNKSVGIDNADSVKRIIFNAAITKNSNSLIGLGELLANTDPDVISPTRRREIANVVLRQLDNPTIVEAFAVNPVLQKWIPQFKQEIQSSIIERISKGVDEVSQTTIRGRRRGNINPFSFLPSEIVKVDTDHLDDTGEVKWVFKDRASESVNRRSFLKTNKVITNINQELLKPNNRGVTLAQSISNMRTLLQGTSTRPITNSDALREMALGNTTLQGIFRDSLNPDDDPLSSFVRPEGAELQEREAAAVKILQDALEAGGSTTIEDPEVAEKILTLKNDLTKLVKDAGKAPVELVTQEELDEIALGLATAPREDGE